MTNRWIPFALSALASMPLAAQSPAPVVMPAGSYIVHARDTSATAEKLGMAGWPFVLKGNGDFSFTSPDTLLWTGKLVQKDGMATYTDQGCSEPGIYYVRKEGGGYAFDAKSETCSADFAKLLFIPGKPKK